MSIFDPVERVSTPPSWRCPRCRTLQPETSSCRSCSNAAVTCLTCCHYQPSIVGELGFCATDPARTPRRHDDVQPCWMSGPVATTATLVPGLFDASPPAAVGPSAATALTTPLAGSWPDGPADPARDAASMSLGLDLAGTLTVSTGSHDREDPGGDEVGRSATGARGRLVEAPHVAPTRGIVSALQERLRRGAG
jgi:hypothetical protein